jgi:hypothetical protein
MNRVVRSVTLYLWIALTFVVSPASTQPDRVERLVYVGQLWGTVRYLHPYLAYKDIDWDAALIQALPRVRAAETPEQYADAVQSLLDTLGDPVTRVRPEHGEEPSHFAPEIGEETPITSRWVNEGVLAVNLRSAPGSNDHAEVTKALERVTLELREAKAVILDLRGPADSSYEAFLKPIEGLLTSRSIRAPSQRYLEHSGYRPQTFVSSGGYTSGFVTLFAETFQSSTGSTRKRVVFLVDSNTAIPELALALQAAGDGVIVSQGRIREEGIVKSRTVDLGEGFEAVVRTTELVPLAGWSALHADVEVGADEDGAAFQAALRLAGLPLRSEPTNDFAPLPEAFWRRDRVYTEMRDPAFEYRLLAVFRFWNIVHYFYPYKHLVGNWDAVLPEFIVRMEKAESGRDYALTLAEMSTRVPDGHTILWGHPELNRFYGEASVPIATRWIEEEYVVTAVRDDPETRTSGIEVGDILLTVDGQPIKERLALYRRYLSASTRASLIDKLAPIVLAGPRGSTVILTIRGRKDQVREVKLRRESWIPEPRGEVVRFLPGNLGYVDLTRLTVSEVEGMFERLRKTRGIIFDMRGYPQYTVWAIAPRLNTRGARYGAVFRRPIVSGLMDKVFEPGFAFSQPLPVSHLWKYEGRTVMLIDERTISQGEHTGLFFEVANGTEFVGTPTAGANGDVTDFSLPGGIRVRFTGHDVRHADGRQLQRIGLVPHVKAAPTIQGIREGRDEVLERAIRYLQEKRSDTAGSTVPAQ